MKKIERKEIVRIDTNPSLGLNEEQVKERVDSGYSNKVSNTNEKTIKQIIFENVFTFFNTIIFIVAVIFLVFIIYLRATDNQAVIDKHFGFSKFIFLFPAVLNIVTGTIQQIRSKKVLDNLKIVTSRNALVVRDGIEQEIKVDDLVVDDITIVNSGDQASSDMIVLDGILNVDESMLTGESDYIKKQKGDIIYSGSSIIVGHGTCKVDKVGDDTYVSELQKKVKSLSNHKSELLTDILKIMKFLAICLGIMTVIIISTLMYKVIRHGDDPTIWDGMTMSLGSAVTWARIMITVGSFAIGVIPSGLVLTTSLSLVLSVVSLARQKTLVQELYSLENLSRIDTICLDKTGTLTDGTMKLVDVKCYVHLEVVAEHTRNLLGKMEDKNQTAQAIYERFFSQECDDVAEFIPFTSATKYSGIRYKDGKEVLMGAPEYMLDKDDSHLKFVEDKAKEGKRVIALLYDKKLIAFFVIEDHIRDSAHETLKFFRENNVDVKVISGDNPLTVSKIAKDCGIKNADKAISLEGMPLEEIQNVASKYTIFARVSPEQKAALVEALQKEGHKVAMTGDGVNDILALRKADSSITFAKATDAAKSCSDIVLLDNDFSHLKAVVDQGRKVINNTQRTSILFLMKSIAILLLSLVLIPLAKGQMWYTIENAYLLEASVIGLGSFFLAIEPVKQPIRGKFIQNINGKVLASGILAATAILIPIMLYRIPVFFGNEPIIKLENVKTLITILLALSGYVVMIVLCVPFNKYRIVAVAMVGFGATALAFILPTSYIGGNPMGGNMLQFNASAGETFLDCQFLREFLKPWNAKVIINLWSDIDNFILLGCFVTLTIPLYIVIMKLINKDLDKQYEKERLARAQA